MAKGENIYRRKDGRWEGRYKKGYNKNHKIKYGYCYGHSYRETKEKLNRAQAEFILNVPAQPTEAYKKIFDEYCAQWIRISKNRLKKSTIAKYRSMVKNHIKPQLGNCRIEELNTDKIADFSDELLYVKHLAVKTVRDILTFVHEIIVYIQNSTGTKILSLTISYPKTERKELRILSLEEERYFIHYLLQENDIYKSAVILALLTGLRIGEICALKWKYISLEAGFVSVRQTVQRIKNPDSLSKAKTILSIGTPKTSSSIRMVPITDELTKLLKNFCPDDPNTFLMTGTRQPMDPRKLQRKLKKYTVELGLREIHFHTLRHTFATRCIEVGCDIKTLSEMLGHSSISTTMNRYVHPDMDLKRQNILKLEQAGFFPPSPEPSAEAAIPAIKP